jgi:hypothetical protein
MPNGSFYADGVPYAEGALGVGNVPVEGSDALGAPKAANSSFYPDGTAYEALNNSDAVLAEMAAIQAATEAAGVAGVANAASAAASALASADSDTHATAEAVIATTQAGLATTQVGIATAQAGVSTTQAGIATSQAVASAASATAALASQNSAASSSSSASTFATNASNSAVASATSASGALASLNSFKGVYYGSLAADPTLDPLGTAINSGDLYWNTTSSALKIFNGTTWNTYLSSTVFSVFGRTGAVVAAANDYTFAQIGSKPTTINGYGITDHIVFFDTASAFTAQQSFTLSTLTDAANIVWAVGGAQKAKVTLAGNRTMSAVTGVVEGTTYFLWVIQDATGSRTVAWATTGAGSFDFGAFGAPTLTTTASKADLICFEAVSIAGTLKLRFAGIQKGFS